MRAATRALEGCGVAGVSQVEIMHGKGTGALRAAIHAALARRRGGLRRRADGPSGDGVTLVAFR